MVPWQLWGCMAASGGRGMGMGMPCVAFQQLLLMIDHQFAQPTLVFSLAASLQRDEEIERLQQQLARVAAERDELREVATTTACTAVAATQHINAFSAVARGAAPPGPPASSAARGPAAAGELQPPGGALPRLHSAGRPLRGLHRSAQAPAPAQQQVLSAQPQQQSGQPLPQPQQQQPQQQPAAEASPGLGMVSAFAGALQLPFSFE